MNDDAILAKWAREMEELREKVRCAEEAHAGIRAELYCIGGPLNDNRHGYSREQLVPFGRIAQWVET